MLKIVKGLNLCNKYKKFELNKKRPKVLLLGNGLFRDDCKWNDIIDKCSKSDFNDNLTDDVPYSIRANVKCDILDSVRQTKYKETLEKIKYGYKNKEVLEELLSIPFDAILTSNYTYQIEETVSEGYINLSDKTKNTKYCFTTQKNKKDKGNLYIYNHMKYGDVIHDIWHIHGEMRRKSSIILTHDEYARNINRIIEYTHKRGYNMKSSSEEGFEYHFKSWVDYFILGDLYILGFGFDYSEFDMWWLLNRRLREKSGTGKVFFYENKLKTDKTGEANKTKEADKIKALKNLNVEWVDLGHEDDYTIFYRKAVENIKMNITETV